jgi:hypothetical protein
MRALALTASLLGLTAAAQTAADPSALPAPTAEAHDSRWTGGVTVMWGEAGPHADTAQCCLPTSVDGYGEFGHKLGDSLALLVVGIGEFGLTQDDPTHLVSGGFALRLIGDRLGGLAAPIELTLGAGVGRVLQGSTPLDVTMFGVAFFDTVFPVTEHFRLHSQLIEHLDYLTGAAFLTAGLGLGVTFE